MPHKILCVDDSAMVRKLLARIFQAFDCEVFEAENGDVGLGRALEIAPDLIILDHNMPVCDGLTMLTRAREHVALKRTPVIMLTAEAGAQLISAAARLGVRDYITKPFQEDDLVAKISRVIALRPSPAP